MRLPALFLIAFAAHSFADLFVSGFTSGVVYRFDETTGAPIDSGIFASTGLSLPHGVMRLADGTFIVASAGNDRVLRYSATGTLLNAFIDNGTNGVPSATLDYPVDFTLGPDGLLYVTSQLNDRVVRFNATTGTFVDVFIEGGPLDGPSGLTFGQNGDLYVVGRFSDNVLRYDGTTGALVAGFAPGSFGQPFGIAMHPTNGELYVADGDANSVRRIDPTDGHTLGTLSGGLGFPIGAEFGPGGNLFVASFGGNQITRYNGATFSSFASTGASSGPNFFTFAVPEPKMATLLSFAVALLLARHRPAH